MRFSKSVAVVTAGALLAAAVATPAAAQYAPYESCADIYNRTIATYQTYGPGSLQYADMLDYYYARCRAGAPPPPAYPYYAAPAPVNPGAAIVGGLIGGAVIGGVLAGRHHHRRSDHRRDGHSRHRRH